MPTDRVHWFHDIGLQTQMRDIGWVYVALAVLLLVLTMLCVELWKDWTDD